MKTPSKKIALLSCDDLTGFVTDEEFLISAFKARGYQVEMKSWTQPADWASFDAAIIRTTWDYTKNPQKFIETLEQIQASGCRVMNPPEVVKWNFNKSYLKKLEQRGVAIIPTEFYSNNSVAGALPDFKSLGGARLVVKPCVGANAEGFRLIDRNKIHEEMKAFGDRPQGWLVQEFQDAVLAGEISFHFFNKKFSHAVLKVPKKDDVRVQEEHGGLISLTHPPLDAIAIAKKVLDAIDEPLLYARVDMLSTQKGLLLMEVELIEPALYFRMDEASAARMVMEYEEMMN